MSRCAIAVSAIAVGAWLAGCPAPRRPAPPAGSLWVEVAPSGEVLRGAAGDGAATYAAVTARVVGAAGGGDGDGGSEGEDAGAAERPALGQERTTIEARRGAALAWRTELAGGGGPLARTGELVVAAVGATGTAGAADGIALRGSPGAVAVGLDAATGAVRWQLAIDASEWAVISAVAPAPDGGAVIGGAFGGSLRAGAQVVSSGGASDGFVARLSAAGEVRYLVRMGGPGADAVRGVATAGERLAIAGTFSVGADLLGTALDAVEPRTLAVDGFVAELDAATGRPRWAAVFGGKLDDAVAGVAIDARGRVAVAGVARDVVHVNGRDLLAQGDGDALVAWWERDGAAGPAVLLGGAGFDGATGIAAVGERVVVGAFFEGALRAGERVLRAAAVGPAGPAGRTDALLATLDASGAVVDAWAVGGQGRAEIAALSAVPGGVVAGISRPVGAAVIVRPVAAR